MNNARTLMLSSLLAISAPSFACMESFTDGSGTWLANDCGKTVSYSFCFGNDCTPPADEQGTFTAVRGMIARKQISTHQHSNVKISMCLLPKRLKGGKCY